MRVVHVLHEVAGLGLVRDGALAVREERLHLHERVEGQRRHGEVRAGGHVGWEVGPERLVDGVQVADVAHEHGEARHVAQRVPDALRHGLEVLEALGGLLKGAALDELAGLGVEGKLGRQVVVMGERHGLRVQGACGRTFHVPCQDYVVTAH